MLEKAFNRAFEHQNKSKRKLFGQGCMGKKPMQRICSHEQNFKKKTLHKRKLVSAKRARKRRQPDQRLESWDERLTKSNRANSKAKQTNEILRTNGLGLMKVNSRTYYPSGRKHVKVVQTVLTYC